MFKRQTLLPFERLQFDPCSKLVLSFLPKLHRLLLWADHWYLLSRLHQYYGSAFSQSAVQTANACKSALIVHVHVIRLRQILCSHSITEAKKRCFHARHSRPQRSTARQPYILHSICLQYILLHLMLRLCTLTLCSTFLPDMPPQAFIEPVFGLPWSLLNT
jgi:hypothetical protein